MTEPRQAGLAVCKIDTEVWGIPTKSFKASFASLNSFYYTQTRSAFYYYYFTAIRQSAEITRKIKAKTNIMIKHFTQPAGQILHILLHCQIFGFLTVSSYFKKKSSKWQRGKKKTKQYFNTDELSLRCKCSTIIRMPHDPENTSRFSLSRPQIPQLFWEQSAQNYQSFPTPLPNLKVECSLDPALHRYQNE